jgi:glycerol-3-phosphate dehydrogenase (NAD(P)+)
MIRNLAIIGAGGWGTALAVRLSNRAESIRLWAYEAELAECLQRTRINSLYLPAITIPANVEATAHIGRALMDADIVVTAVPSQHVRGVFEQMRPALSSDAQAHRVFVSATKGLESDTLLRMSEVMAQALPSPYASRIAVLSGPTFAQEIAKGSPAAVVIASADEAIAREVQEQFSSSTFRLYTNSDVIGVEIGGAVKNVIAIAAGVCDGLNLGSNAIAALVTRGLSEITRLACACGARRDTLAGLAGLGDLVLTCTGVQSRNHAVGVELGRGRPLREILQSMRMVAEGVNTTAATVRLARQKGVEMPITEQMHAVLYGDRPPRDALRDLMVRTLKAE